MKILIHLASGAKFPDNYRSLGTNLFSPLGDSLCKLGFEVVFYVHPKVADTIKYCKTIVKQDIEKDIILNENADIGITWGGHQEADKQFSVLLPKVIYGELGYFNHYQTCIFDRSGTNAESSILLEHISDDKIEANIIVVNKLRENLIKPRLIKSPYIFVPLQLESDNQITKWSVFSTMTELLNHLIKLNIKNKQILYKVHPYSKVNLNITNKNLKQVRGDIHSFIPYADLVAGINSTSIVETLLYHGNILTFGSGLMSRNLSNNQRINYIAELYARQRYFSYYSNPDKVIETPLYKMITT